MRYTIASARGCRNMPVIASAKKKMRKDIKRTKLNKARKETLKKILKSVRVNATLDNVGKAQSLIDKMAKVKLIHKNKAARLKSQIAKLVGATKSPAKIIENKTKPKAKKLKPQVKT